MFVIRISTYLLCKSWSSCKGSIHLVGVFAATAWEYCNSKFGCCVAESATHSQTIVFLESDLCSSKKPMSSKSRHARRFSMLKFIRKSGKGVLRTTLKLGMSIPYGIAKLSICLPPPHLFYIKRYRNTQDSRTKLILTMSETKF